MKDPNIFFSTDTASQRDWDLKQQAELLYRFVIIYYNYCLKPQDYGYSKSVTMIEAHTVTIIDENPGITISQLAAIYNRTTSAISQLATKLENKGLIERKMVSNLKNIHLYTTPDGNKLSRIHKLYDSEEVAETLKKLLTTCTIEEISAFFKVLQEYIKMLREEA